MHCTMESLQDEEYPSLSAELLGLGQPDIETSRQVEQLEHGVYFVRNVLSKAECDAVLAAASRHMHMIKGTLDSQRYRDLKRSIFMCPEAAETVYKRLQCLPLFKDSVEVWFLGFAVRSIVSQIHCEIRNKVAYPQFRCA